MRVRLLGHVSLLLVLAGGVVATSRADAPVAAQEPQRLPVGVVPGAPAGSPDQAPDSSNFDYSSLFHEFKPDDTSGFVQIFDGKTLNNWDGDPVYWRVENGSIVGESTPTTPVTRNTFLIWRGERLRDFE